MTDAHLHPCSSTKSKIRLYTDDAECFTDAGLAEVEAFDCSRFADENAATPELMQYHQKNLEQHGIEFGRNAFGMIDLRPHKTALAISSSDLGLDLRGGVDAGVIPCGCLGHSAGIANF